MYKVIVMDCDGTLLNSGKKITERTLKALKLAENKGAKIVLASARSFSEIEPYIEQLGLDKECYTIAFNGALVCNNQREVLLSKSFKTKEVIELISEGNKYDIEIFLYTTSGTIANKFDERYPGSDLEVVNLETYDFTNTKVQKVMFVETIEKIKHLKENINNLIYDKYEVCHSEKYMIEFVNKGITKSKALDAICDKYNVKPDDMIAFGDGENDIPMIEYAGYGVAMGNAVEEAKACADYVTTSNDEDGIALVIERIYGV